MNRDERRRQKRTIRTRDAGGGDTARGETNPGPSSEDAEAPRRDPYRDEGGEG